MKSFDYIAKDKWHICDVTQDLSLSVAPETSVNIKGYTVLQKP